MAEFSVDLDACAANVVARIAERQRLAGGRAERLRAQAREAGRVLTSELGARRVWLFGSLAWGSPHVDSDVDLLVEGLDRKAMDAAERRVQSLLEGPLDLVRSEDAPASLVERVTRDGVRLDDAA